VGIAVVDVKKCITFCRQLKLTVLGVIENMSGFVCPHCNHRTDVFAGDGGREMAGDFKVPLLGKIPMDPALAHACDLGKPFISLNSQNTTVQALSSVFEPLLGLDRQIKTSKEKQNKMRIAIPVTDGKLSAHFGHCEEFAMVDVDEQTSQISNILRLQPPAHEPGVLPQWLSE